MLSDSPLIAGTPGQYALINRISRSQGDATSILASAVAQGVSGTSIVIPIQTGQGIQIRDTSANFIDNGATNHLTVTAYAVVLQDSLNNTLVLRGPGTSLTNKLGSAAEGWGTDKWPVIAWNDFPQLASSLAPNLQLKLVALAANDDAGAAHNLNQGLNCIFEVWQAFNPRAGHVGFQP